MTNQENTDRNYKNESLPSQNSADSVSEDDATTHGRMTISNTHTSGYIPADIQSFLRHFHGDNRVFLVALKNGQQPVSKSFKGIEREKKLLDWIKFQNVEQNKNLYFYPARIKDSFTGIKATKADVLSSEYVWLDLDPPKDLSENDLNTWRENVVCEIHKQLPATILVDSGKGLWAYWKLKAPCEFDGPTGAATRAFEMMGKSLTATFRHIGADNCYNIDRLARLPGTINHKNGRVAAIIDFILDHELEQDDFPILVESSAIKALRYGSVPPYEAMVEMLSYLNREGHFTNYSGVESDAIGNITSVGWVETGMALKIAYGDEGKALWELTHDQTVTKEVAEEKWNSFSSIYTPGYITVGTVIKAATDAGFKSKEGSGLTIEDFHAYLPEHKYYCEPTGELWPAASINACLLSELSWAHIDEKGSPTKIKPSVWLDNHQSVEQMIWAPGQERIVKDRLLVDGGWINRTGVKILNLYRSPCTELGDASKADPWISHLHKIYPDDANHIIAWLAHRVQKPEQKINHALVLGGNQGVGKDSLLEPLRQAIGPWNFVEASPKQVIGRFNGFLKSVILRISEGRDLGEVDRYSFYESMKTYTAAPPDILRVDEKNIREHNIFNVCGIIITTNHKTNGIYLPSDDRRHYVAWSDLTKEDFATAYWEELWSWYQVGGINHVTAYLQSLDISWFNPKEPPRKTEAFYAIVNANAAPEDAELADVLEQMGWPQATTSKIITDHLISTGVFGGSEDLYSWLMNRKNRRAIPHRMEQCGYAPIRNPCAQNGLWVISGKRQVVYAKLTMSRNEQIKAAGELAKPE